MFRLIEFGLRTMRRNDIAAYVFLAITWGASFVTLLKVIDAFGCIGAVTLRSLLTSSALILFAYVTKRKLNFNASWKAFTIVGATTVVGQLVGLSYATPFIGTAMAAIIVASIPLFSIIIAQIWKTEKVTPQNISGLMLGIIGIVLLVGFPAIPVTTSFTLGCIACFASCFCAAYGSNYANRYMKNTGSWEITIGAFFAGGLMSLPFLYFVPLQRTPELIDYAYLLIQSIVMSGVTYITYFKLVSSIGPTKAISVEFLVTIIAVFAGVLFLNEPLTLQQVLGAVIIIVGCALVLGLLPRKVSKAIPPSA